MNYYISDLHIGCTNSYENRTLEHDMLLKENWNKCVTNADDVYILGDIGKIGSKQDTEYLISFLATLKGRKHLICGNHDQIKDLRLKQLFVEICEYKELVDNFNGMSNHLVLSHYPILMWNGQHKGYIHLYGHVHNTKEEEIFQQSLTLLNQYFQDMTNQGKRDCPTVFAYNVGVMCPYMDYWPRTLKEILKGRI